MKIMKGIKDMELVISKGPCLSIPLHFLKMHNIDFIIDEYGKPKPTNPILRTDPRLIEYSKKFAGSILKTVTIKPNSIYRIVSTPHGEDIEYFIPEEWSENK